MQAASPRETAPLGRLHVLIVSEEMWDYPGVMLKQASSYIVVVADSPPTILLDRVTRIDSLVTLEFHSLSKRGI